MESKFTRRSFNHFALSAAIAPSFFSLGFGHTFSLDGLKNGRRLVHPGMLHSKGDLARIQDGVRAHREPIMAGFEVLKQHPCSQSNYSPRGPVATIGRNPTVHVDLFDSDCNAAYQCALMWCITGDQAYARLTISILNGWTATLKEITGADAVLCASLGGFKLINAAELIRYSGAGWSEAEAQATADFFRQVFLPVLRNFAPFANGNWDTAAIKCMMAIGIFCDDTDLVDTALQYYLHGCGDGRLENYISPGGQCQESGRDQQHTQLGLAHMGDVCEMAWNQGLDLYGAVGNRLLEGFEYTARYNLGLDVAFSPDPDRTGKYAHQVISARGLLRPVYEQIYNHYVHRRKMEAPYTQRAAEKLRPEGAANDADHTGFGTLLYSRTAKDPAFVSTHPSLGVLHAVGSATEIQLEWIPSYLAARYTISRASVIDGTHETIATDIVEPKFIDRTVTAGRSYVYRAAPAGVRNVSRQVVATAGLPRNWSQRSYGEAIPAGHTEVADDTFILYAYGSHCFSRFDELHFVYRNLIGDDSLTARLSPSLASQVTTAGLMVRTEDRPDASMVALTVSTASLSERPQWVVSLLTRENPGEAARIVNDAPLDAPFLSWGRITQPIWLRISRDAGELHAELSRDGLIWKSAGKTSVTKEPSRVGCFACSGLGSTSAQITFEKVTLKSR
jgi:hypothetical protein